MTSTVRSRASPRTSRSASARRGALRLQAIVRGRMAHGAMPLTGLNPLPLLAQMALAAGEVER